MDASLRMTEALQEVIDHHEIRKLLSVYCHGCDRGDEHRMASVYLDAALDDHGPYKGSGKGLAKRVMNNLMQGQKLAHLLGQCLINVRGDEAGAETYFMATAVMKNQDGRDVVNLMGGRYVDTLSRDDGQWKISNRICVRDWSISLDVDKDWLENTGFVEGQKSGEDPSYTALGLQHPGLPAAPNS